MRTPVPEEMIWDLALRGVEQYEESFGLLFLQCATLLPLQTHGYLRPSEAVTLRADQVIPPARGTGRRYGRFHALVIAPQDSGETTKTGQVDDSIIIGDDNHYQWLNSLLPLILHGKAKQDRLFPQLTLAEYESWLVSVCRERGYGLGYITPHVMRHSGPSNDRFHQRLNLAQIQKRGRWSCKQSVVRYEKEALLLAAWDKVTEQQQRAICKRARSLPTKLQAAWSARPRA